MKFSTALIATALTLATATSAANAARDAPNEAVTYYIPEGDHTCTFAEPGKEATCKPGRVDGAQDMPDDIKKQFKFEDDEPPSNGDGPANYFACRWRCRPPTWLNIWGRCGIFCN